MGGAKGVPVHCQGVDGPKRSAGSLTSGHGCLKRLFINFKTKMSYFISHEVGNPVQITKSVVL